MAMDAERFLTSVSKLNAQFFRFVEAELAAGNSQKLLTKVRSAPRSLWRYMGACAAFIGSLTLFYPRVARMHVTQGCADYIREASKLKLKYDSVFLDEESAAESITTATLLSVAPLSQTKTIYLIRHGEGFHNIGVMGFDSRLTPLGWAQSQAIHARPELVVSSPLSRALETAVGAFGCPESGDGLLMAPQEGVQDVQEGRPASYRRAGVRYVVHESCRERAGPSNCDARNEREALERQFPGFDFRHIPNGPDTHWVDGAAESESSVCVRGLEFFRWLMSQPERKIAVVTHSAFLWFSMSTCFVGSDPSRAVKGIYQKWFENGEMRAVVVTDLLTVRDDGAVTAARQTQPEPQPEPQLDELLG
jgi:broad specificity phosphatase PhoE